MIVGFDMNNEATEFQATQPRVGFWSLGTISFSELFAAVGILGIMVGLVIGIVG